LDFMTRPKLATADVHLLAELQAAQSELDAVNPPPDGEADRRGLSQALATVISEIQVHGSLPGIELPRQT
jgi:hypothetical protein